MPKEVEQIEQQQGHENRDIELFLSGNQNLEIELQFGISELNRYLEDLQMLQLGVPFSELGIYARRQSKQPRVMCLDAANDGTYSFASWRDLYSKKEIPQNSIALLQLSGVMRSQSGMSSPGIDSFVEDLMNAYNHPNVMGVIIETNSGGGESLAGNMLNSAIQDRNKPVVGFGHLVASAAYRALSGADEIIASSEASEFGSIGTMISLDNKILNKYRSRFADFYGGSAPGKNSDFRAAISGDFSGIQKRVDELTLSFQNQIKASRQLRGSESTINETVNGSMFNAIESKKRGLVDMVGTMQTAVKRVKALRGKY
jgi:ClpP class serine protease